MKAARQELEELRARVEELERQLTEAATKLRQDQDEQRIYSDWLSLAQRAAQVGFWCWDIPSGKETATPGMYELFGLPPTEEHPLELWKTILHPADLEQTLAKIHAAVQERKPYVAEYRIIPSPGQERWLRSWGLTEYDDAGQPQRMCGMCIDITDLRRTEQELRSSEECLRLFIEHAPAAVAMFDNEMRYLAASGRWLSDYRLKQADIVGRSHYEVFPEITERWKEIHRRCLAGAVEKCDEDPFPRADGSLDWIRWEIHPWRNAHSEIGGIIMFTENITERKEAVEHLREMSQRLTYHVDHSPLAVIEWGPDMRVTRWSGEAERIFGWTAEEVLGKRREDIRWVYDEDERQVAEVAENLRNGMNPRKFSANRNYRKDGTVAYCEWYNSALLDEAGRLHSILSLVLDVTERRQAEERLRQTQKLESLGVLAGGLAHDFNNLLVGVIGYGSLAQQSLTPNHPACAFLNHVLKAGEQAATLTRQMLAYSGKGRFLIERLNLSELISEINDILQHSISKNISQHYELARDLQLVEADRGQMQQVLMNLVLNAAESIAGGSGEIWIRTGVRELSEQDERCELEAAEFSPGKYVYLEVRDTGCGMDEATRTKIFDPFFSTKFTGRGLGLAAVAGIVRSHKGAIQVTSAPGKGSCFTVFFPACADALE
jgi:PAS domain S-box-containing protein